MAVFPTVSFHARISRTQEVGKNRRLVASWQVSIPDPGVKDTWEIYGGILDRSRGSYDGRHAPARQGHLGAGVSVAHHRSRIIG